MKKCFTSQPIWAQDSEMDKLLAYVRTRTSTRSQFQSRSRSFKGRSEAAPLPFFIFLKAPKSINAPDSKRTLPHHTGPSRKPAQEDDVSQIFSQLTHAWALRQSFLAVVCVRQRARLLKTSARERIVRQQISPSRTRAQERRRSRNFPAARLFLSRGEKLYRRCLCSATSSSP